MDPILYLVHRFPFPPDKGDRIRAYHILQYLAKQGPVHLATLADEHVSEKNHAHLANACGKLAVIPLYRSRFLRMLWFWATGRTASEGAFESPAMRIILRTWCQTHRYRACLVSASSLVPYLLMPELRGIPAVVDMVDVDSQKWFDYAARRGPPRSWLYRLEGRRLRTLEQKLPAWVQAVTLVSQVEANLYCQFTRTGNVLVVPNGISLEYFQPSPGISESGCVFVGALDYYPNVDGICWFCREVWPEIRRRKSDAQLSIVGRRPTPAVWRLARLPGVEVVGQVSDVRPYYERAAVVVAPLRIARGIQNKVLEALAMGKALVATPATLAGVSAQPGVHLLQATSSHEWVDAVVGLLQHSSRRSMFRDAGRKYVEENHRWDHCLKPLGQLLAEAPASSLSRG